MTDNFSIKFVKVVNQRPKNMNRRRQRLLILMYLYVNYRQPKRFWIRSIYKKRKTKGDFHNLIKEMRLHDVEMYNNYMRMNKQMFGKLVELVGPHIDRRDVIREAIHADQRVAVTLRFLASGDSMTSLSFAYRIAKSTISCIIAETCAVIWDVLKPLVFPLMNKSYWKKVSTEFYRQWNYPQCLGAIDGKHVVVEQFNNTGSLYYNYKHSNSIVLLAVTDANYNFIMVDIGAAGSQSDGGILKNSVFGRTLDENKLDLPSPTNLPSSRKVVPYVFLGDEGFPLKPNLMRPYPKVGTPTDVPASKTIFNYRLSRARRVVENSFGILSARWRIFRRPILAKKENVVNITKAAVCLHNWVMKHSSKTQKRLYCPPDLVDRETDTMEVIPGTWRNEESHGLIDLNAVGGNRYSKEAGEIRNTFKGYFVNEGQLKWQWEKI